MALVWLKYATEKFKTKTNKETTKINNQQFSAEILKLFTDKDLFNR